MKPIRGLAVALFGMGIFTSMLATAAFEALLPIFFIFLATTTAIFIAAGTAASVEE